MLAIILFLLTLFGVFGLMAVTLRGPLKKVEFAPWAAAFDPSSASWTEIPIDDLAANSVQFPTPEEATSDGIDGTPIHTANRSVMTLPVTNFAGTYLSSLTSGSRYVVRLTFESGASSTKMLFGKSGGAVLTKGAPGGAAYGDLGVQLLRFTATAGADVKTYEVEA